MTTREEFERLLRQYRRLVVENLRSVDTDDRMEASAHCAVMSAWDERAAEVAHVKAEASTALDQATQDLEAARAQLDALRTGVTLTADNAARARVVETHTSARAFIFGLPDNGGGALWRFQHGLWRTPDEPLCLTTEQIVELGATVLAWSQR